MQLNAREITAVETRQRRRRSSSSRRASTPLPSNRTSLELLSLRRAVALAEIDRSVGPVVEPSDFFGRRAVAKRVGFLPREAASGARALPSLADAASRAVDSPGRDFVDGLWPKNRRHRRWGERARARARASYGRAFSPSPES